jgi:hypothetical protein
MATLKNNERGIIRRANKALNGITFIKQDGWYDPVLHEKVSLVLLDIPPKGYSKDIIIVDWVYDSLEGPIPTKMSTIN